MEKKTSRQLHTLEAAGAVPASAPTPQSWRERFASWRECIRQMAEPAGKSDEAEAMLVRIIGDPEPARSGDYQTVCTMVLDRLGVIRPRTPGRS